MKDILKYYFKDGTCRVFDKYMLYNFGFIRNRKTGQILQNSKIGKYNCITMKDEGNTYTVRIARAIASTFIGPPPSLKHTADHIDRNPDDDSIYNIRWATDSEQNVNKDRLKIRKSAFIVVKGDIEKTANEWTEVLKKEKNDSNYKYTTQMILNYAREKQHGFSYKEYQDLPGETWKRIVGSKNGKGGRWEISDMNRVKYITKHATNILSEERFCLEKGYPTININNKKQHCHILSFMTFFPDEWDAKKSNEIVLHKNDDRMDFRPHMLRLGTHSENRVDAYNNGCHDGTHRERHQCVSYINGVYELLHDSQSDAMRYLVYIGYKKAKCGNISMALSGDRMFAYDRTWKPI